VIQQQQQQQESHENSPQDRAAVATLVEKKPPETGAAGIWLNFILDESGSMSSVQNATIENFNKYLKEQRDATVSLRAEGEGSDKSSSNSTQEAKNNDTNQMYVSLMKFDAPKLTTVYDRQDVMQAPFLTTQTYCPNGGTNLLDALGSTVERVDSHLETIANSVDRPAILVVVLTDGAENSSVRFNSQQVKTLVSKRREAGWTFVFLGANIDAWSTAESFGISAKNAFNFSVHAQGSSNAALSTATKQWRVGMSGMQCAVKSSPAPMQASVQQQMYAQNDATEFFDNNTREQYESSS